MRRIELKIGEEVTDKQGKPTSFIYLGIREKTNSGAAKVLVECGQCGSHSMMLLDNLRRRPQRGCINCCVNAPINLGIGDIIKTSAGEDTAYTLVEELPAIEGRRRVRVRCSCGNEVVQYLASIRGQNKDSGCSRCVGRKIAASKLLDLSFQRFGRLQVVGPQVLVNGTYKNPCMCDCGNEVLVRSADLRNGNTKSCGCLQKEASSKASGSNWEPGTMVGHFKVIEKLESTADWYQRYKVLNTQTNRINLLPAGTISQRVNHPLRLQCRKLLLDAMRRGGFTKKSSTFRMLGCSYAKLMEHLGPKPTEDAHIDHICPCAQAQDEEELIKLQYYTNLRWMPAKENLSKGCKRTKEAEEMCRSLLHREWI